MKKIIAVLMALSFVLAPITSHKTYAQAYGTTTYTVQPGDSLWKISVKYKVGLSEIINANPQIKNPDLIYPNEKIKVPLKNPQEVAFKNKVIQLTNQERTQRGLKPLTANWQMSRVAKFKAQDMRDKGYFSHTSPTYGSPFQMMRDFNISFSAAGENIAGGQKTPQSVVNSWMQSPGHRRNILSKNYTQIGVGYAQGGKYGTYWVQEFRRP